MRCSLFLAVASVLVASTVSAHDGPHDPPTTGPPSVCMTNPADASCSSYILPAATLNAAIDDICHVSSFLPGCSLAAACKADTSLSASYCAPLTILATLCKATEDTALTTAACAKSYNAYCSAASVIPACKTQVAFPGLPSGKVVTGTIYSVCQEMPTMKDCKTCPGPNATTGYSVCDEVSAWKGLCLDMPDMTQCPSYNTMCSSTKFAPFCDLAYKAPGAVPSSTASAANPAATGDHSQHGGKNAGSALVAGSMVMASVVAMAALAVAL